MIKPLRFGKDFKPGDRVVFCKQKHSSKPGPRAKEIDPAPHGEEYSYQVDKFWVVAEVLPDQQLVLHTRRGKRHVVTADDPRLRRASWWEKLLYRGRFPQVP